MKKAIKPFYQIHEASNVMKFISENGKRATDTVEPL